MKIIILNLSRKTTEEDLSKLFTKFGEVSSCQLVLDVKTNESKGFGFIEMQNQDEATQAISELHHTQVAGNRIRVKLAEERE